MISAEIEPGTRYSDFVEDSRNCNQSAESNDSIMSLSKNTQEQMKNTQEQMKNTQEHSRTLKNMKNTLAFRENISN
ncbi:hypothetical protein LXL04_006894 [Taraxacum kok-saghyz]